MKKRKRVVRAGNLVWATICTPPAPNDPEHVRAAKSRATTAARKALNQKAACRRLEMLLATNFTPRDFHLILTYRPDDLPATRKEAAEGKPNGAQSWTPSRGLTKPTVETSWVDGDETLTAPAGCYVIEREDKQNEFAGYSYIHYRIERPQSRKTRPRRSKTSLPIPPTLYEMDAPARPYAQR